MTDYPAHKPGPWIVGGDNVIKRQIFDDDGNDAGYELLDGEYPGAWIAAAELLEALEKAVELIQLEYCSHAGEDCSATNQYCYAQQQLAAIAKAKGGAA